VPAPHRDDGRCLGVVVRYYTNMPAYAWGPSSCGRYLEGIGTMVDEQAARAAVDRRLELVAPYLLSIKQ
jgi:hypothetical protein